jgi:hypothetical protein
LTAPLSEIVCHPFVATFSNAKLPLMTRSLFSDRDREEMELSPPEPRRESMSDSVRGQGKDAEDENLWCIKC